MHLYYKNIQTNLHLFDESMHIYQDVFEDWEREPKETLLTNILSTQYTMIVALIHKEVVGFYIVDTSQQYHYSLLTFLAVKPSWQGKGIGSQLCLKAKDEFLHHKSESWLFIEAQERQAKLYTKLGFQAMELEYLVPKFDSNETVSMQLMLLSQQQEPSQKELEDIIKDIFCRGYELKESDARLREQLKRVKKSSQNI